MGKIVVLDDQMINMIAAGEVIERPASVVKELLENSIDAGAGKVVVEIEDGGRRLISVTDDGDGIGPDDLKTAFLPHATSKIRTSDDLLGIATMGFRGEALASIASVAQVSVTSRRGDSVEAHRLDIDCGDFGQVGPCAGAKGTTIEVRNLFCKLPARRKFLRTANTEMGHISEQFARIALACRNLDMTLTHNGRQLYRLVGGQTLIERIGQLLSRPVAEDLLETVGREKDLSIQSLLGKPASARASGKYQYIFLNRRFIRDKFIGHAIREAYRGLIEPNKYPVVFLFLEMPPAEYDVNVHPTKVEVRFRNANLIHSQVLGVLREKLLSANLDVQGQVPAPRVPMMPPEPAGDQQARKERIARAMAEFFQGKADTGSQRHLTFSGSLPSARMSGTGPRISRPSSVPDVSLPEENKQTSETPAAQPQEQQTSPVLQIHDSYIVVQTDQGFDIIDQHALHERIIYESLCRRLAEGPLPSQRLLIPETLEVTEAEADALAEHNDLIEKLGLELAPFGPRTMAVQAFPALLKNVAPLDFVRDLLDMLTDRGHAPDAERLVHEALDMAACKAAVKAGAHLTQAEMLQLLADKETVERASRCPHGRPTTIRFTLAELEKQFKRTGF